MLFHLDDKPKKDNILTLIFGREIRLVKDFISFSKLDDFQELGILDRHWALVKYHNYESKKIIDLFTETDIMVNANHPFVNLLINHKSSISEDEELKIRIKLLFKSFGYHSYHYDVDELIITQRQVLDRLAIKGLISTEEVVSYLISKADLPIGLTDPDD